MVQRLEADYLVVGAGATGMAFTDALTEHSDASVVIIDRRHGPGGHWLDAYPFVRLHQASAFYGVASTLLGGGRLQSDGPEAGLAERASAPEVCAYYDRVLRERLQSSGQVSFMPACDYRGEGRFVSLLSGREYVVRGRVVNAHHLSPTIPARTEPPFRVGDGVRVVAVNELASLGEAASQYVIVGAGKTATDACVWLLGNGVDPDAIRWVRSRDPWMLNRAKVQPDPVIFWGLGADVFEAASLASSPTDLFLRMEAAGVMLRIDPSVMPTMAKTPTLAQWELDELRTIEDVIRLGHVRGVESGRLSLEDGDAAIARDAVVVHCAASGLQYSPLVPIWGSAEITLQPIRTGFPCFGAALAGYAEATIDSDEEKNRLCPPSPYSNTMEDWPRMNVLGTLASLAFTSAPDLRTWSNEVPLNPAAVSAARQVSPELSATQERFRQFMEPGLARMRQLAGMD
ncbi:FAD-dependent pyridine nucleotide-disulfide oxidoreductase [Knoellia sinensis KCTC 19936]|uniref:FAD-dependent pyridine nucleotide-disulfide oxidoreductase n=1 Tax=Knoellia sinensis KCTC 19936 TaxID=1385520 RepID=A0A0A0J985_9MICO|nr:FAD/NAD(P)-binding protein [Knoellia sinensis]KGN33718.1 FAD-dependent pyridine nucleotide-disulfide oxidoreductase [Knoellia sinensis KCTC 19936]